MFSLGRRNRSPILGMPSTSLSEGCRNLSGRGPGADGVRAGGSVMGLLGLGKVSDRCVNPYDVGSRSVWDGCGGPNPPYALFPSTLGALMLPDVPGRSRLFESLSAGKLLAGADGLRASKGPGAMVFMRWRTLDVDLLVLGRRGSVSYASGSPKPP